MRMNNNNFLAQRIRIHIGYVDIEIKQDTHLTVSKKAYKFRVHKNTLVEIQLGEHCIHTDTKHGTQRSEQDSNDCLQTIQIKTVLFSMTNKLDAIQYTSTTSNILSVVYYIYPIRLDSVTFYIHL